MQNKDTIRMKKRLPGTTGILCQQLLNRQKEYLATVADIDEFKTSITCNVCKNDAKMTTKKLSNGKNVNGILVCENACKILWQRDINASKNTLDIANSIWDGKGRPAPFTRSITVEETVLFSPE